MSDIKTSVKPNSKVVFHIYPNTDDAKKQYQETNDNKNGDAGIDIRFPKKLSIPPGKTVEVDLEVKIWCECEKTNVPFLLVPRSSIGKTPLLAEENVCPLQGAHDDAEMPAGTFKFIDAQTVQPNNLPSLTVKLTNTAKMPFVITAGTSYFQVVDICLRPPTYRRTEEWDPLPPTFPETTGNFELLMVRNDLKIDEKTAAENAMIILKDDITFEPKTVTDVRLGVRACFMLEETPWASWLVPFLGDTQLKMKNWMGLIDAGYRGELIAKIYNAGDSKFMLSKDIAVFGIAHPFGRMTKVFNVPPTHPQFADGATLRGNGAFGSTGETGKK